VARLLDFADGFESSVAPDSVPVDATQVSVTPDGNLSSTDAQAAFEELQGDIDAINTSKGANNGIATLDSGGKVPSTQLPAIAITEVYVVADITERDALTVDEGDIAKVTDAGGGTTKTFIYDGSVWVELQADGQLAAHESETSAHGVAGDIVGTSDAQIISNKDFDGGTASNSSRLTVPKNTKSNLDSLTRKEATIVYATDEAKAYIDNGSTLIPVGSGSGGGLNYIENGDAELASPAPSLYADSGSSPTDGSGGSVNTSTELNFSRSTSSPLRGSASWVFDKKSGNQQGKGGSFPFTIDVADKGKQASITFDYSVLSGTYATGDVAVYVVHDPSGTPKVIQPSAFNIENVGVESLARLTFQTEYSSVLDYNLCFHVASTSASAYSLKFDNITLGPQVVPMGAPVTDWVSYTPTFTALGTPTGVSVESRRIGDTLHVKGVFTVSSGSPSEARISLGYAGVNNNVTTSAFGAIRIAGHATFSSNTAVSPEILAEQSVGYLTFGQQGSANAGLTKLNGSVLVTTISFYAQVPIVGWSSSTVVSSSADTRVVTCRATRSATQTGVNPNNSAVKVTFNTANDDTAGGFDTVNSRYVAKVPGKYRLSGSVYTSGTNVLANTYYTVLYVNGAAVKNGPPITASAGNPTGGSVDWIGQLAVGDYVELFLFGVGNNSVSTLSVFGGINSSLDVELVQGPSQIQAAEVVAFQGTAPSYSVTTSIGKVTGWTASEDSHAGYNTANSRWIVPAPGRYRITINLATQNTAVPVSSWIYINGVNVNGSKGQGYSNGSVYPVASATIIKTLNAGQYVEIFAQVSSSTLVIDAASTSWTIERLGGV